MCLCSLEALYCAGALGCFHVYKLDKPSSPCSSCLLCCVLNLRTMDSFTLHVHVCSVNCRNASAGPRCSIVLSELQSELSRPVYSADVRAFWVFLFFSGSSVLIEAAELAFISTLHITHQRFFKFVLFFSSPVKKSRTLLLCCSCCWCCGYNTVCKHHAGSVLCL